MKVVRWLEPLATPIGIRTSGPNCLPGMSNMGYTRN